ncbi:ABC transporter permease [Candidatus Soleaferrea massiliensis]|uniref:ABC transporter permease n=1 Tax=Candidatus Soleaferrea massiliensis TaxID=1470354 RepID=UPI00058DAF0B|nr:ABC transporter permease [Candidatus Soleaferrea massiliensis]
MNGAVQLTLWQFLLIYLLLIVVLIIMKRAKASKTKLLFIASIRMTVQLILVGLLLQYIFEHPHPVFTVLFLAAMLVFSIHRVLSTRKDLNRRFKAGVALALGVSGLAVLIFFVCAVVGEDVFNPQYTIPLAGMIIGNAMTGVSLGLKTFMESIETQRGKIEMMVNLGLSFKTILRPFVNRALESALLPTINSMLGMGIIFLPGMMTGQILSGTLPTTAIMYQIAIMIAICASVCLSVFLSLWWGYRTLYNGDDQYIG